MTCDDCKIISEKLMRAEEHLKKVRAHGCCVMHNDSSCPGCIAGDYFKGGSDVSSSNDGGDIEC